MSTEFEIRRQLSGVQNEMRRITDAAEARGAKVLSDDEDDKFRACVRTRKMLNRRLAEVREDAERRDSLHNKAESLFRASQANNGESTMDNSSSWEQRAQRQVSKLQHIKESLTYSEASQFGPERRSFFRDLISASTPGADVGGHAAARLARHREELQHAGIATPEKRTGITTTDGAIGEFAPPQYLLSIYVKYARPNRVTANLLSGFGLDSGPFLGGVEHVDRDQLGRIGRAHGSQSAKTARYRATKPHTLAQ